MTSADYSQIWAELEGEAGLKPHPAMVLRLLPGLPDGELHLGVSTPGNLRHLLIRMPDDWNEDTSDLPRWHGTRIQTRRGVERPTPHAFLEIQQGQGSPADVFEALVGDVCSAVAQRASGTGIEAAVTERLSRWKAFFDEGRFSGLGPEAQQGLFGELWFLLKFAAPRVGFLTAIEAWTGSAHTHHDFQFPHHAFEVKSSVAKQHVKVHIASERQLETLGVESLNLVVLSFNVIQGGGEKLPDLVDGARGQIPQGHPGVRSFDDKLLQAGYIAAHAGHYTTGYAFRSERTYLVSELFPRLREKDLPVGVGDVAYTVMLSACESFRRPLETALDEISSKATGGSP
ncbi:MAG: PD-(D/E)XK motif protein [Candidatus Lutacidiplasmatales archaeon]